MGIYDRDYYQEESTRYGRFTGPRSMVTTLIIINVAIAILDVFSPIVRNGANSVVGHALSEFLAVDPSVFSQPWNLWRLLTAGFAHASIDVQFMHIVFNMYTLWLFGRDVEALYGPREFLRLYLVLVIGASTMWALAARLGGMHGSMVGASGAVTGIALLFILHYPNRQFLQFPFFFPIPAWIMGILLIGGDILGALGIVRSDGHNVAYIAHLSGALIAFIYYRSGRRLESILPAFRWPKLKSRPKLRIVREDTSTDDLERRADEILAKMHETGAESLSPEERRILNDFSRRMRQKLR